MPHPCFCCLIPPHRQPKITKIDFDKEDPTISFSTYEDNLPGEILLSKAESFNDMGLKSLKNINFLFVSIAFDQQLGTSKFKFLQNLHASDINATRTCDMSYFDRQLRRKFNEIEDSKEEGIEIDDLDELELYLKQRAEAIKQFKKDIEGCFPQPQAKRTKFLR